MSLIITKIGSFSKNNKLVYDVVTDNADSKRMRLILDVEGVNVTLENEPELGTNDTYRFEISSILRNKLTENAFNFSGVGVFNQELNIADVFNAFEDLGAENNVLQTATDSVTLYPFNFFRGQNLSTFLTGDDGNTSKRFLTNSPQNSKVKSNDVFFALTAGASFSTQNDNAANQSFVVEFNDGNGDVLSTNISDYFPTPNTTGGVGRRLKPFGKAVTMPDDANVFSLTVYVQDKNSPFALRSEKKTYKKDLDCRDSFKIYWLNMLGVYELTYLLGNVRMISNVERKTYTQGEPVNAGFHQGGVRNFENDLYFSYEMNIERTSPTQVEYLSEILQSTQIYLEKDGGYVPLILTDTNLTYFDKFNSIDRITFNFIEAKKTKIF